MSLPGSEGKGLSGAPSPKRPSSPSSDAARPLTEDRPWDRHTASPSPSRSWRRSVVPTPGPLDAPRSDACARPAASDPRRRGHTTPRPYCGSPAQDALRSLRSPSSRHSPRRGDRLSANRVGAGSAPWPPGPSTPVSPSRGPPLRTDPPARELRASLFSVLASWDDGAGRARAPRSVPGPPTRRGSAPALSPPGAHARCRPARAFLGVVV